MSEPAVTDVACDGLFQQAYRASIHLWRSETAIRTLGIEELILGGRMATRLGGERLGRRLFIEASMRSPEHPLVPVYGRLRRGTHLFDEMRQCVREPELKSDDPWVVSRESVVLMCEDRWDEAYAAAERSVALKPGSVYGVQQLGHMLMKLGRVEEAARRLAAVAAATESCEVCVYACWCACAWAVDQGRRPASPASCGGVDCGTDRAADAAD